MAGNVHTRRSIRLKSAAESGGVYLILVLVAIASLLPIYFVLIASLKTGTQLLSDIDTNIFRIPLSPTLENFGRAWVTANFRYYIPNTIYITAGTLLIVVVLSTTSGFVLAKLKLPWEKPVFLFLVAGFTVPFFGYMIPLFYTLRDLSLINTRLGVILTLSVVNLPFGVFFMRAYFRGLPGELLDSARMDGCGVVSMLVRIMGPLAGPATTSLIVIQAQWSWKDLIVPLIITHEDKLRPISVGLTLLQSRYQEVDQIPLTAAGTLLSALPMIVIYLVFQRQFVRGMVQGSLK